MQGGRILAGQQAGVGADQETGPGCQVGQGAVQRLAGLFEVIGPFRRDGQRRHGAAEGQRQGADAEKG
ncbi:hypothetical protein D3C76_1812210 [compost metagenome]